MPGQDRVWERDILGKGARGIIAASFRVGRSNHGAASLQRCHDASLRDGDALLLHGLHSSNVMESARLRLGGLPCM